MVSFNIFIYLTIVFIIISQINPCESYIIPNRHNITRKFGAFGDQSFLYQPLHSAFTEPYHINPHHRFWKPNCICHNFEPLGDLSRDGYKMVCREIFLSQIPNKDCLVYSLGSNGNFDFETAVHLWRPECEIHTFDMDYFQAPPFVHFHRVKLGVCEGCTTIKKLMKDMGHENTRVDLFKCDIEGTEWDHHINHMIFNPLFNQILLETHDPNAENMRMMAKHQSDFCLAGMNLNVACLTCMELVFVNKIFLMDLRQVL